MADRLAAAGFVALAPDLYHGELAGHTEMDKAARADDAMPPDRAARDMSGAVDYLADHDAVTGDGSASSASAWAACSRSSSPRMRPDKIKAAVPFYGFPQGDSRARLVEARRRRSRAHGRERRLLRPRRPRALESEAAGLGKDVTFTVHPGTGHAFMAPHNALGTHDEARSPRSGRGDAVPARQARLSGVTDASIRCGPVRRGRSAGAARPDGPGAAARAYGGR